VNILIIGLGSISKKHIAAIRELQWDAAIYALRSSKNAEIYRDIRNIYSLDELTVKPDFVIISNPTRMHEESILGSLRFNCPLFIEKPVLSSLSNASSIISAIENKKIISYIACNMRFHPALQFIKKYLQDTLLEINEVNIYCGSYLPEWRPEQNFRENYSSASDMGGGVHLDLIHELDYCMWLFGQPSDVRSFKRNTSTLAIDAVDCAYFHLAYPAFTANISLNYYRRDPKREIEIITSEDTIEVDLLNCRILKKITGEILFEEVFTMAETYIAQLAYFKDHICQNKHPMNGIEESVATLKIAMHE
jgi:predicted dehydrogenase